MSTNEKVEFYLRFLQERHNVFRAALNDFLKVITLDERPKKLSAAKDLLSALDDLKRAMSRKDHPNWIDTLENKLKWYVDISASKENAGRELVTTIMDVYPDIDAQTWDFVESSGVEAIDFAAIYQEYYRQSRIPDLFDELVSLLQEIVDSETIDSLRAINALQKLIRTIKQNSRGDFFSTRGAWEFTQVFCKNFLLELLENTPVLKRFVKPLLKTMSELDLEFSDLHNQVQQRINDVVEDQLPMLQYKSLRLPAPKDSDRDDTTADT